MTVFQIEARDPLVIRDGRPNDIERKSESRTLPFPLPSTLVGVVRTTLGRRKGTFDPTLVSSLLEDVSIRGPLLVGPNDLLVPAPGDALLLRNEDESLRTAPLGPIKVPEGAITSSIGTDRSLVGLPAGASTKAKPLAGAPRFWTFAAYEEWLRDPKPRPHDETLGFLEGSVLALEREERVHVAMGPHGTAKEGKLFATEGLRLEGKRFHQRSHVSLELFIDVDVKNEKLGHVAPGLRPLGGERRLSRWSTSKRTFPALPAWLEKHVEQGESALVRVLLLTPAFVASSLGPKRLERPGVAAIVAAKVDRPQVISGWDLAKGGPKKTRRLADTGSVYWVRLSGSPAERRQWVEEVWMRNISDDEQLSRDGFGLAAIGIGRER